MAWYDLDHEDLGTLLDAPDSYEAEPARELTIERYTAAMLARSREEARAHADEFHRKIAALRADTRRRDRAAVLKAKLIYFRKALDGDVAARVLSDAQREEANDDDPLSRRDADPGDPGQ